MKLSRRDQTVLGIGISVCGALFLLSSTIPDGLGLALGVVGIGVLGTRPPAGPRDEDR
ncbi:hypothetical protein DVS28_a1484 [Euzebya pacifica]|uniref:Uncharacterized protein n=1 Tax=Euzebya pacifica TaxID=1608957 RepID=A0A346XVD1_9ACTN|nr:hypothetical protein [Euzebya pacifica]AXV06178.1 hypothetical protein DVS28_a1484 [Euzebya pacifica]